MSSPGTRNPFSSLEGFKSHVHVALGTQVSGGLGEWLELMVLEDFSSLNNSVLRESKSHLGLLLLRHGGGWPGEMLSLVHVSWAPKFLLLSLSPGGWQLQFPCWFQASSLQTVGIAQQTRGLHLSHLCESENNTDIFGCPEVLLVTSIHSSGTA